MKYFGLLLIILVACAPAVKEKVSDESAIVKEAENITSETQQIEKEAEETQKMQAEIEQMKNETEEKNMGNTIVELETTMGKMKLRLFDDKVPVTAGNFRKLVEQGFYDGTIFHRVIRNFMIQGGDPTGTGRGGPGYTIKDEFAGLKHSKKGILSMANAGPNTGGSQFFIILAPTPWLDGKHAIFGELIEGEDVLDKIGSMPADASDRPKTEVKIIKAKIVQ